MSILFDIIYLLLSVVYLPALFFKGKHRIGIRQRFGMYPPDIQKALKDFDNFVWVHAVSVGEMKAAAPLIEQLQVVWPEARFIISTITPTGNTVARQIAGDKDIVIYFPFDLSFIVKKTLFLIRPKMLLIMETELWPNMIRIAAKNNIPIVIANGRISDGAYPKYKMFSFIFSPIIKRISFLCMQSEKDAQRIIDLGADKKNVKSVGNIKFDQSKESAKRELPPLKNNIDELLIVAGSTHDNEEEMLARVYISLRQRHNKIRLLIAPRHPHRAVEVVKVLTKYKLSVKLMSLVNKERLKIMPEDVLVLDTMGALPQAYKSADIVFIGGSLIRHGGQNPIEAAFCHKPIIFGKYMYNFHEIESMFLSAKAAIRVDSEQALEWSLERLIQDKGKRDTLAENAWALVLKNKGSVQRIISLMHENKCWVC